MRDEEEIPELPTLELIGLNIKDAKPLGYSVPKGVVLKLARLQTLSMKESEKGEMSNQESLKDFDNETMMAMCNPLGIQEDTTRRVMMIERLIVETVRETYPAEYERLDVDYSIHPEKGIMWRPMRR